MGDLFCFTAPLAEKTGRIASRGMLVSVFHL
jgi:hypothetical protein